MPLVEITDLECRDIADALGIPELVARCVSIMVYHYKIERSARADAELEDEARGIATPAPAARDGCRRRCRVFARVGHAGVDRTIRAHVGVALVFLVRRETRRGPQRPHVVSPGVSAEASLLRPGRFSRPSRGEMRPLPDLLLDHALRAHGGIQLLQPAQDLGIAGLIFKPVFDEVPAVTMELLAPCLQGSRPRAWPDSSRGPGPG